MKDLGVADVILGIKISRTSDGLVLSQSHYIEKILAKFSKYDTRYSDANWISILKTPILQVDMSLQLEVRLYHGDLLSKLL
ncbi:unnamed protein product [Prunus brigantina]